MKTVIVGCGRVGAALAGAFDRAGHQVIIIDRSTSAFDKLDDSFGGTAIRGDGTDEDVLLRAGAEDADLFLALTEGDNRNTMSAQLAVEALGARQVVAKINDPLRAEAYADLGIATICRTDLMLDAVLTFAGLPVTARAGVQAAKGQHLGGEHHDVDGPTSGDKVGPATALPDAVASPVAGAPAALPPKEA
jgi:trk system potassium uptake protein